MTKEEHIDLFKAIIIFRGALMNSTTRVTDAKDAIEEGLGDGFVNNYPILEVTAVTETVIALV